LESGRSLKVESIGVFGGTQDHRPVACVIGINQGEPADDNE